MKRKYKYGAAGALFTVIFLAVLIVVNLIFSLLSGRMNLLFDVTKDKRSAISDATYMLLDSLDKDVSIYTLTNGSDLDNQFSYGTYYYNYGYSAVEAQIENFSLYEYLNKYDLYSDKVALKQADPDIDPTFVANYEVTSPYDIVVVSGSRYKTLPMTDLYAFEYSSDGSAMYITGMCVEQKITSAIEYVSSDRDMMTHAAVINHNETVFDMYSNLADEAGYETTVIIDLMRQDIPEDVKYLSIIAPDTDYSEDEIKKLQIFLDRGDVTVAVYLNAGTDGLDNLASFLSDCGIGITSGLENIIVDESEFVGNEATLIAKYGSSEFTENLSDKSHLLMQYATPLTLTQVHEYTTQAILMSSQSSRLNGDASAKGPFAIAAQATKGIAVDGRVLTSRIIVNSAYTSISDDYIGGSGINNADFTLRCMNTAADVRLTTHIGTVSFENNYLDMSHGEIKLFTALFVYIIPIALLAAGLAVYIRREHK